MKKVTIHTLRKMKQAGERITMLTAYDASFARLLDQAQIDVLLVGDSLGMVVQGHDTTLPVTMDQMVYHCAAVARGTSRAHLVGDMPFGSYQASADEAVKNAMRLIADARALEEAGCYSLILEAIPGDLGAEITRNVAIPTVGIGAGLECDGQVLVVYDLLGMNPEFSPKFVKKYANLAQVIGEAATRYREEVRGGAFPSAEHTFSSEKPGVPSAPVKLYSVAGRE